MYTFWGKCLLTKFTASVTYLSCLALRPTSCYLCQCLRVDSKLASQGEFYCCSLWSPWPLPPWLLLQLPSLPSSMWVQVPAWLPPWGCPGHVPVHQEARSAVQHAAACSAHGFILCMHAHTAARPTSSVLMHVHCSIEPHF